MEKICGKCSQEKQMPIEERIAIAMSREPKVVYTCPVCKEEHFFNAKPKPPAPPVIIEVAEETPKKSARKKKEQEEPETFQLELF